MRLLPLLALLWAGAPQAAPRCSIYVEPRLERDPDAFVFEGRVVGFTTDSLTLAWHNAWLREEMARPLEELLEGTPEEVPASYPRAGALLLEPVDVAHAPRRAARYAVFPADLDADCSPIFSTADSLAAHYAIGDRLLVVAHRDRGLSVPDPDALPLFAGCCVSVLARVSDIDGDYASTVPFSESIELRRGYRDLSDALADPDASLSPADEERLAYEYARDLVRLYESRSEEDRIRILLSIRAYRFYGNDDCGYVDLVQRHLRRTPARDRLGAYLLIARLRPFPTPGVCQAAQPLWEELQRTRER